MASSSSAAAAAKAKAKQVVAVKDGKVVVTDKAAATKSQVEALPDWLSQGPDVAAAYVEGIKGLSTEGLAIIKALAVAVATLRDRVATLS